MHMNVCIICVFGTRKVFVHLHLTDIIEDEDSHQGLYPGWSWGKHKVVGVCVRFVWNLWAGQFYFTAHQYKITNI